MARLRTLSPSDPLTVQALNGFFESAPAFDDLEFYSAPGNADTVERDRDGAAVAKITRSLNENLNATPPPHDPVTASKKIVTIKAQVDRQFRDRGGDVGDELARQVYVEAREAGWVAQALLFSGDSAADSEDFDGLQNLVDPAWVIPTAPNGWSVLMGGDAQALQQQGAIELLLYHMARVRGGAQIAWMNEFLKIRFLTIAKKLGYYTQVDTVDGQIEKIGNTIIRGAGYTKAGMPNLPTTETQGTNSDCTSIYFARLGEKIDLSYLTTVGLKAGEPNEDGSFFTVQVDMDVAPLLQAKSALVRSAGWRLA